MLVQPMVERNVPWASVYGNHDEALALDREELLRREEDVGGGLCFTRNMVGNWHRKGVTNYYVLLKGDDGNPVAVLWFFDSRGGRKFATGKSVPMFVPEETVTWFELTREGVEKRYGPLHSLVFVHVPPSIFSRAQKVFTNSHLRGRRGETDAEEKSTRYPGLNDDDPLEHQDAPYDQSFIDALKKTTWLHSVYSGHDHGDTWCVPWPEDDHDLKQTKRHGGHEEEEDEDEEKGPMAMKGKKKPVLCFAKHTGYGGYGDWNRGARVVNLQFNTWSDHEKRNNAKRKIVGNDRVVKGRFWKRHGHDPDEDEDGNDHDDKEEHHQHRKFPSFDMQVETWIRMEDGRVVQRVGLNGTYSGEEERSSLNAKL
jgi:hypothetical protein